jgi:hypothetical protein
MPSRFRRAGLVALAALSCVAVPALAAPDYNATLSASVTSFAWDGGPGTSAEKTEALEYTPCGSPNHHCEDLLLKLEAPGALTVEVIDAAEGEDPGDPVNSHDLDIQLFESDASGTPGKQLAATESTASNEKITKKGMKAGFYLVRVDFFRGVNLTYKGQLKFEPATVAAPVAAAPAPAVTAPAPAAAPSKPAAKPNAKKVAACKKKAKKIKNAKKRKAAMKRCTKKR